MEINNNKEYYNSSQHSNGNNNKGTIKSLVEFYFKNNTVPILQDNFEFKSTKEIYETVYNNSNEDQNIKKKQ